MKKRELRCPEWIHITPFEITANNAKAGQKKADRHWITHDVLLAAMKEGGSQTEAAKILGISPAMVGHHAKKHGIETKDYKEEKCEKDLTES